MEQDIEKENRRLRDLLYDKIIFIEQLKKDYRTLTRTLEEITDNYNKTRDLTVELKAENVRLKSYLQEIKAIAEHIMTSDTEKWTLDEPFKQIEKILELTKAEEE